MGTRRTCWNMVKDSSKRRKHLIRARTPPSHRQLRAGGDDAGDGAPTVHRRRSSTARLPALPLEFLHEGHERVDSFFRKRVVNRRASTAELAMSVQTVETSS